MNRLEKEVFVNVVEVWCPSRFKRASEGENMSHDNRGLPQQKTSTKNKLRPILSFGTFH